MQYLRVRQLMSVIILAWVLPGMCAMQAHGDDQKLPVIGQVVLHHPPANLDALLMRVDHWKILQKVPELAGRHDVSFDLARDPFGTAFEAPDGQSFMRLWVIGPRDIPEAKYREIWDAIRRELEGTLTSMLEEQAKAVLPSVDSKIAELASQLENAQSGLRDREETYLALQANRAVGADQLRQQIQEIFGELRKAKVEFAVGEARRQAVQEAIATLREKTAESSVRNNLLRELELIVTLREQVVTDLKTLVEQRELPTAEAIKAQIELAQARVQLLEAQAADPAEGTPLQPLEAQLTSETIQAAEGKARIQQLEGEMHRLQDELKDQLRAEIELRDLESEVASAKRTVESLQRTMEGLVEQKRSFESPRVQIVPYGELTVTEKPVSESE